MVLDYLCFMKGREKTKRETDKKALSTIITTTTTLCSNVFA